MGLSQTLNYAVETANNAEEKAQRASQGLVNAYADFIEAYALGENVDEAEERFDTAVQKYNEVMDDVQDRIQADYDITGRTDRFVTEVVSKMVNGNLHSNTTTKDLLEPSAS